MGSSTKRKKEKKQDFQKPKLKVGKTRPKATNFTDTSFKAKSIVVQQQSLSNNTSSASIFSHQLSLLSSKSSSQRHESLSALTNTLRARQGQELPHPINSILTSALPLLVDASKGTRDQLLKLLQSIPAYEIAENADLTRLLTWVHVGITHLSSDIKASSLDVLDWLLDTAGQETVSSAGSWIRTLRLLMNLLGWRPAEDNGKWTTLNRPTQSKVGSETKLRAKQISLLAKFLDTGFRDADSGDEKMISIFPLWHTDSCHLIGTKSNPFGHLNLFGAPRNEETEVYDDVEGRKEVYIDLLHDTLVQGLQEAKKEGGEVGRASSALSKVLRQIS